jgi:hypothetical protein
LPTEPLDSVGVQDECLLPAFQPGATRRNVVVFLVSLLVVFTLDAQRVRV